MIRVTITKCHKVIIWKSHLKQLVNGACAALIFPTTRYITLKFVFALFDSIVLEKFQGYRDSISFLTSFQFFLGNLKPLATILASYFVRKVSLIIIVAVDPSPSLPLWLLELRLLLLSLLQSSSSLSVLSSSS